MKRRITPEQLQELTPEQQQKLRDLWKFEVGDICTNEDCIEICIAEYLEGGEYTKYFSKEIRTADCGKIEMYDAEDCLPLLDIGQMIELLAHRLVKIDYDGFTNNYYVQVRNAATYGKPELCDALWNAVKFVLQEEAI